MPFGRAFLCRRVPLSVNVMADSDKSKLYGYPEVEFAERPLLLLSEISVLLKENVAE